MIIAIEKETMASKMSRVLDSMKVVFKNNRDFQKKIAVAEEVFEAQVIDEKTPDDIQDVMVLEDDEIEMKLSFEVVDRERPSPPNFKKGTNGKKFRIIAIEGDDEEVSPDDEVDVEWE